MDLSGEKFFDLNKKLEQLNEHARKEIYQSLSCMPEYALSVLGAKCKSPIERLLLEAILLFFHKRNLCDEGWGVGPSTYTPMLEDPFGLSKYAAGETNFIDAQVRIENYYADFVVARIEHNGPDRYLRTPHVVVECDGHDFHERTKEQAQSDKLRDRVMQQKGYAVLRFTGSEIWRDPWGCAVQINDFLEQKIKEENAK